MDFAFVTLHVGAGTFQPVRVDRIEDHHMHKEYVEVPDEVVKQIASTRQRGGRVVAVGYVCALLGKCRPRQSAARLW